MTRPADLTANQWRVLMALSVPARPGDRVVTHLQVLGVRPGRGGAYRPTYYQILYVLAAKGYVRLPRKGWAEAPLTEKALALFRR